ncbi:MAG TPA: inositol monophosphatase family protein [Leptospiraceae bacterium]|nr:inositol monophosphatase family protein [Leptospiraceae bacterium]HMW05472.1 inositol monophosphatase family protein [Leptospiraceae bacterium]HMX33221.1 inositol monophosphatase family protein [Leptospiraceae bacterium]HMY30982.1 inositol monophosphatase family protein [Leptospiraceae bacterium]HMZ64404.1 inositol monophosphatase family protein [Leptospiraceae bacterium]
MKEDIRKRFEQIYAFLPKIQAFLIHTQNKDSFEIQLKGPIDLVTEADKGSEKMLVQEILKNFPDDHILGEEGSSIKGKNQYRWIIDPVDGTTNFAHRLPLYGVCIGLENIENGHMEMGLVSFPAMSDVYYAIRGYGAFKNEKQIYVSKTNELINSLASTGFPYEKKARMESVIQNLKSVLLSVRDVRRTGVASLDLCWVAEGRFDAYWEENLKPWDMAAASIIVEEAGGRITTYDGNNFSIFMPNLVATNATIHRKFLEKLSIISPQILSEFRI